jgi:hypothetical protein
VAALDRGTQGALQRNSLQYVALARSELNVIPIDLAIEGCAGIDAASRATCSRVFHLTNAAPPTLRWLCDVTTNTLGFKPVEIVKDAGDLDPEPAAKGAA